MFPGTSKREHDAAATRELLLDVGRVLFVSRGFTAVSAEELVRSAGLSRGALYHHFDGKLGLLRELVVSLQETAAARIGVAMAGATSPSESAVLGAREFLRVCCEPDYREIVLLQGPLALGWHEWRELDRQHLGGLVLDGVRTLQDEGLLPAGPPELLAATLYGALTELSLVVASSADPDTELERAVDLFADLLAGLAPR